ncbi:helix-turn-helix transcriptional regulator [Corynebacterium sp. AOP36-E1-14]|uniref:helix-turn-helix transcriptional regulator n=1 Tax=unclassified Corynebacterium TaxID=2624378 RepID=UPI003F902CB2
MNQTEQPEALVSTKEVAKVLGVSPEQVRRMFVENRERGDEPVPLRLSAGSRARLRWRMSDVVSWIEAQVLDVDGPAAPQGGGYAEKLW